MPPVRICPNCGEPVEIPEGEDEPPVGAVVRHAVCPSAERAPMYRYIGTYSVARIAVGDDDDDEGYEHLGRVVADIEAEHYTVDIAAELATKVGNKIQEILPHSTLADR